MYSSVVLQKQRGQGATQLGKKKRKTCTANLQIFSTVSTWEGNFRVYSLYCRLPRLGGAKREISLWVLLNAHITLLFRALSATAQGRR